MVRIKIRHNENDIRRISVPKEISFAQLVGQLRKLLSVSKQEDIILKYVDEEGDHITISSDLELHEALTHCVKEPLQFVIFKKAATGEQALFEEFENSLTFSTFAASTQTPLKKEEKSTKMDEIRKSVEDVEEEMRRAEELMQSMRLEEMQRREEEAKKVEESKKLEEERKEKRIAMEEARRRVEEKRLQQVAELEEAKRKAEEEARKREEELQREQLRLLQLEKERAELERRRQEERRELEKKRAELEAQRQLEELRKEEQRLLEEERLAQEKKKKDNCNTSKPYCWGEFKARNGRKVLLDLSTEALVKFRVLPFERLEAPTGHGTVIGVDQEMGFLWIQLDKDLQSGISYWDDVKDYDTMICKGVIPLGEPANASQIPKVFLPASNPFDKTYDDVKDPKERANLEKALQDSLLEAKRKEIVAYYNK